MFNPNELTIRQVTDMAREHWRMMDRAASKGWTDADVAAALRQMHSDWQSQLNA